ncbi:hypothetical protein [Nocardioides sp.]|uniref:hypothetical protein n=1 Tax=Nocardioides sp. TaxID=35761 RepID=UPI0035295400
MPPAPGWGAAHKPGAVPLRPLGLGDIYGAAFKIIRVNPSATVGSAVLVAAVSMLLPVLATAALALFTDFTLLDPATIDTANPDNVTTNAEIFAALTPLMLLSVGSLLSAFGLIFVTGMVTHVTAAAAVGRRVGLGEAWAATHGRRWRLVGLSLTLALMWSLVIGIYLLMVTAALLGGGDVGTVVAVVLIGLLVSVPVWFFLWIRVSYLAVPPLMLERVGVFGAIGRGWQLTRRQFWRTFGIALLTVLVTGIASNVLGFPLGLIGGAISAAVPDPQTAVLVSVAVQALASVLSSAFTAPFTSAVTCLQYVDQRIRKEAYDMELLAQAGVLAR